MLLLLLFSVVTAQIPDDSPAKIATEDGVVVIQSPDVKIRMDSHEFTLGALFSAQQDLIAEVSALRSTTAESIAAVQSTAAANLAASENATNGRLSALRADIDSAISVQVAISHSTLSRAIGTKQDTITDRSFKAKTFTALNTGYRSIYYPAHDGGADPFFVYEGHVESTMDIYIADGGCNSGGSIHYTCRGGYMPGSTGTNGVTCYTMGDHSTISLGDHITFKQKRINNNVYVLFMLMSHFGACRGGNHRLDLKVVGQNSPALVTEPVADRLVHNYTAILASGSENPVAVAVMDMSKVAASAAPKEIRMNNFNFKQSFIPVARLLPDQRWRSILRVRFPGPHESAWIEGNYGGRDWGCHSSVGGSVWGYLKTGYGQPGSVSRRYFNSHGADDEIDFKLNYVNPLQADLQIRINGRGGGVACNAVHPGLSFTYTLSGNFRTVTEYPNPIAPQ